MSVALFYRTLQFHLHFSVITRCTFMHSKYEVFGKKVCDLEQTKWFMPLKGEPYLVFVSPSVSLFNLFLFKFNDVKKKKKPRC